MPDANENVVPSTVPEKKSRWTLKRIVTAAVAGFIAIIAAPFLFGVLIALVSDVGGFGDVVRILRDAAIIVLALVSIVIALAIAVLILQVAQLIGIVQTDVKPLLEHLQATAASTRGTVKFVGDTVTGPIVKTSAFLAATSVFLREFGGIRRALKRRDPVLVDEDSKAS